LGHGGCSWKRARGPGRKGPSYTQISFLVSSQNPKTCLLRSNQQQKATCLVHFICFYRVKLGGSQQEENKILMVF
jgi:hypothetical protein